jgi:hypothetical protein
MQNGGEKNYFVALLPKDQDSPVFPANQDYYHEFRRFGGYLPIYYSKTSISKYYTIINYQENNTTLSCTRRKEGTRRLEDDWQQNSPKSDGTGVIELWMG